MTKKTRSIPADVLRLLLAKSGGYCQNPNCNDDLYPLMSEGSLATIREAAHIIAFSQDGPRGSKDMKDESVNTFDNLILLCPTCHTKIDKASHLYPAELIIEWKNGHEEKIASCFNAPTYDTLTSISKALLPILAQNKSCFDTYGPQSATQNTLYSDAPRMWRQNVLSTIIPNNRKVLNILRQNISLFKAEDYAIIEAFAVHKEGFEYNHLSGDKNTTVPLFPVELISILQESS